MQGHFENRFPRGNLVTGKKIKIAGSVVFATAKVGAESKNRQN
jgi:hypothetical protein